MGNGMGVVLPTSTGLSIMCTVFIRICTSVSELYVIDDLPGGSVA